EATRAFPIPNRLLLAAFLGDESRHVPRVLRRLMPELRPEILRDRLIGRSAVPGPEQGSQSLEEFSRAAPIGRVMERALSGTAEGTIVDEYNLFRAFCDVAPKEFKAALQRFGWNLDLDVLAAV